MKIVCDNCATKYSIADEKVRGKVFKIRCKKCSHIIVVKGTEGGDAPLDASATADAAPADAGEPAGADGWHVVVNGEQVGPLSPAEVRGKFSAGEIDAETFAWKEGFGDWQRLASIDEFSDLATSAPASSDATRRTGPDDLFGGSNAEPALNNPGGDLFGGSAAGGDLFSGGQTAASPSDNGGGGLFAQPAAAEPAPQRRAPTPGLGNQAMAADAAPAEGKAMTGQRNENSVLFSLNNLQALASGGGSSKPSPAAANSGVDNRPGFANSQTEGSGLIDIRAMAAATLSSSPTSQSDARNNNDLPQFASAPVFSPIAAPILMPSAPTGPPGWVWPVVGLGVVTLLAIVGLGVFMINKANNTAAQATQAAATATANAGGTTAAAPAAGAPAVAAAPAGTTAAAPAAGTTAAPAAGTTAPAAGTQVAANDKPDHGAKDHVAKGAAKGAAKTDAKAAPVPGTKVAKADIPAPAEPVAAPASKGKKKDDLDDLLNGATSDKGSRSSGKEERASASNDDNLPDQLDKGAIVGGMGKVKGKVGACYEQYKVPGMANVAVTIGKNGRVSNASVAGAFAGTPTGDCVTKAVKSATFPQFKGSPQSINYPFMLR